MSDLKSPRWWISTLLYSVSSGTWAIGLLLLIAGFSPPKQFYLPYPAAQVQATGIGLLTVSLAGGVGATLIKRSTE